MTGINYTRFLADDGKFRYKLNADYIFVFCIFGGTYTKTLKAGMVSDGATWVRDLGASETGWRELWSGFMARVMHTKSHVKTAGWFVHDAFCVEPSWDCGTRITNITASFVLATILLKDGYKRESVSWFLGTLFFGGKEIVAQNGRFTVKKDG